ncbi:MAG TPA: AbrB/MazE/SpoVT family DNA-binding domain-containing protein [Thermomicrobiales bacterium]|nr:AbrB/MazE/SpoVT family DNA-binding domain-containing protein [Thermomicrobiales bacterium]
MVVSNTTITRKGQVTIPADVRRELGLQEGDQLSVERQGDTVVLRRATSVAQRTAGALAHYRKSRPLTADEEREAFELAVAEEVMSSMED